MSKKFAIIDVETTGGSARLDKITEIGIVIHDGNEIIDTYQTLINPERSIPYFITNITGINDQMVLNAPKFYEIAKDVVEFTEDCVFVAHNARFDYGFVSEEFKQLGYTYSRVKMCTVQMSRRAFPGLRSYSLGNLVRHFDIPLPNHHRALDDAMATSELFKKIVQSDYYTKVHPILSRVSLKEQQLPAHIDRSFIDAIPQVPGVYYFYNREGQIIYIGKSLHLRKRIYEHFADNSQRAAKLQQLVYRIDYQCTGNELAALLLESFEIRKYNPSFNKLQRKKQYHFAIAQNGSSENTAELKVAPMPLSKGYFLLRPFTDREHATATLQHVLNEYGICHCIRSNKQKDTCIHAKLGVCASEDDLPSIEERYQLAINHLKQEFEQEGLLVGPGRHSEEKFVALIINRSFYGMGYIELDSVIDHLESLLDVIDCYPVHTDLPMMINTYLKDHNDIVWKPLPSHWSTQIAHLLPNL